MQTQIIRAIRALLITAQCLGITGLSVAQALPPADAEQADATVTELSSGVYDVHVRAGQSISQISVNPKTGDFVLDNSPLFADKRLLFKGGIREFFRTFSEAVGEGRGSGPPATNSGGSRIVTAAHRDYDPNAANTSPGLSTAGVVDIDANGFVRAGNAKSGWVNMPASLTIEENGSRLPVTLSGVTFWVVAGGKEWLSFIVGRATLSKDHRAVVDYGRSTDLSVHASVDGGRAELLVGQHRLRAALATLTGKLEFIDEDPITINEAVKAGDQNKVAALLREHPDLVSSQNTWGSTPLHNVGSHREIAELLLASGADINAKTVAGSTPLHVAATNGERWLVELLLIKNADFNARAHDGATPLHYAAVDGRKEVIELLLASGADVNAKTSYGLTPLHYVAMSTTEAKSRKDAAAVLLNHGADVNAKGLQGYAGETPLHSAARAGNVDVAELLLAKNADVNAKDLSGTTPLHRAAGSGQKDVVALLLDRKADIGAKAATGATPLHWAAAGGSKDVVALLLEAKADVNTADLAGETPLHWAVGNGRKEVVGLLLDNAADVNAAGANGVTPLRDAALKKQGDIAELLRQHGGRDFVRETLDAAQDGNLEKIRALLKDHPDLVLSKDDAGDHEGWTPLHFAADNGRKETIELLLASKADINAKDARDRTPLSVATTSRNNRHKEVAKLLRQHGAQE